jgi:hypothetical protein
MPPKRTIKSFQRDKAEQARREEEELAEQARQRHEQAAVHNNLLHRLQDAARKARTQAEEEQDEGEVLRNKKVLASVHSAMEKHMAQINVKRANLGDITAKVKEMADVAERSTSTRERQKAVFAMMAWKDKGDEVQRELKALEEPESVEVWQADRRDIKAWVEEYRRQGTRARTQDGELRDMITKMNTLMYAKRNTLINQHKNARMGELAPATLERLDAEIGRLQDDIAEFGRTGPAARRDGNRVIAAPEKIQRPVTMILERFATLLSTRKRLQDADAVELQKLDVAAKDLSQILSVHLKEVETSCNIFENPEDDEAGAQSVSAKADLPEEPLEPLVRRRGAIWNYPDAHASLHTWNPQQRASSGDVKRLVEMRGLLDDSA